MLKNKKGITLVALVVTIVVLLILAGVSINLVLGNNGIIAKAKDAETKSAEASENDLKGMNGLVSEMEGALAGNGSTGSGSGGKTEPETVPYLPSDDFHYDANTSVDTGLVIKDANGNEYVWVVVPKSLYNNTNYNSNNAKKPSSSTDYANIEYCLQQYTATYRNGTDYSDTYAADTDNVGWLTSDGYTELKNSMLKSVYENGGFYVGRYEAGIDTTTGTNRTSEGPTNSDGKYTIEGMSTPVTKADAYPYTYVTRTQAQNLASNVNSGTKTSSLMFGVQWDLVLAFMSKDTVKIMSTDALTKNSVTIGNYDNSTFDLNRGQFYTMAGPAKWHKINENDSYGAVVNKQKKGGNSTPPVLITTGGTEQSNVMNIYDIAGNVNEWTLEKHPNINYPCTSRGGSFVYQSSDSAYVRFNAETDVSIFNFGFRISLF